MPRLKTYVSKGRYYSYYRPSKQEQEQGVTAFRVEDPNKIESAIRYGKSAKSLFRNADFDRDAVLKYATFLHRKTRQRAVKKGLSFNLTLYDVITTLERSAFRCAVTDLPLIVEGQKTGYRRPLRPSIDRIDVRLGYEPSNIRVVCVAVNTALSDWGDDVFHEIALAAVFKRYGKVRQLIPIIQRLDGGSPLR